MSDLTLFGGSTSAVLDPTGTYRYRLDRTWSDTGRRVVWVMLNPSTADASVDDPTIRRCKGYTLHWGYGQLTVVNLFALRATDPTELTRNADPVGPENDRYIADAVAGADLVVAAWGAHPMAEARARAIRWILPSLQCLAVTKAGAPGHPLYQRADAELRPWNSDVRPAGRARSRGPETEAS